MKKFLSFLIALLVSLPAQAAITSVGYPGLKVTSPDTPTSLMGLVCDDYSVVIDYNTSLSPIFYWMTNCAGTPTAKQFFPVPLANIAFTGTSSQLIDGTGAYRTMATSLPPNGSAGGSLSGTYPSPTLASTAVTPGTYNFSTITVGADGRITSASSGSLGNRTFNYPSRTLNSCFQVSSTQDADINYSIDISAVLTLGGGTGVITSYTNSGCTTGTQIVFNGAVSSVALGGTSSIPLHAILPAGKWAKITATASGGGTAAIDAVQAETLLP